jgi:hypothetical protein
MAPSQQSIADEAAAKAVRECFILLGVDVDDTASVEEFREDLRFGRGLRKRADQGIDAIFKLVFLAIAGAVVSAIAKYFHLSPPQ